MKNPQPAELYIHPLQNTTQNASKQPHPSEGRRVQPARRLAKTQSPETMVSPTPVLLLTSQPYPPPTLPNIPLTPPTIPLIPPSLNADNPPIDPSQADPTVDDEKDLFLDPQNDEEEIPEDDLELNSQDGSNQSKTISGVKELKEHQPEDDATSAKKARTGKTIETPLNE